MAVTFGSVSGCDGSCTVEVGSSKVCATVFGPRESGNRQELKHDEAVITCEVAVAAFAGENRRNPQRRGRLSEDVSAAVVQVARSVVLLSQYPNSHIHIYVEILRQDGSEKASCINAACLALADANVAMRDAVCCASAACIDSAILVDPTAEELRSQCPVLSAAFTGHNPGNIVWLEISSRVPAEVMERLLEGTSNGAAAAFDSTVKVALEEHARRALHLQS